MHPRQGTKAFILVTAILMVSVALLPTAIRAQGADASGGVTVPMTIDCAAMQSGTPQQQARAKQICDSADGVSPNNVAYGNCGTSTIWVWNDGAGHADIYAAVHSTKGPIVYLSYYIHWDNVDNGWSGGISDSAWPWSSDWSRTANPYTAEGWVQAWMSGEVQTAWGYDCAINYPWDSAQIYW